MRWILISSFLAINTLLVSVEIIDGQLQNSIADSKVDHKFFNNSHGLRRRRQNFRRNSMKYGFLTKNAIAKSKLKHLHRHEKFPFVLRCPELPFGEPSIKV